MTARYPPGRTGDSTDSYVRFARRLGLGGVAGVAGGVLVGLLFDGRTDLVSVFGGLVGAPNTTAGWVVLLVAGATFGAAFAAALRRPEVREAVEVVGYPTAGVGYGGALWAVGGVVIPLWSLAADGVVLSLPFHPVSGFVGALCYGVVVALACAVAAPGEPPEDESEEAPSEET